MIDIIDRLLSDYAAVDEHDVENDGIGGYEYWGKSGFDAGTDYVVGSLSIAFPKISAARLKKVFKKKEETNEDTLDLLWDEVKHEACGSNLKVDGIDISDGTVVLSYSGNPPELEP